MGDIDMQRVRGPGAVKSLQAAPGATASAGAGRKGRRVGFEAYHAPALVGSGSELPQV